MSTDRLTIAALGRPFTLGALYNARTEYLIPGFSLWDKATLQEKTKPSPQPGSSFQISTSDSIKSKSSLLDIDASLNLSVLCDVIKVGGSAKLVDSVKDSAKKRQVTFKYHATTHFEQLSVSELVTLNDQQREIIEQGTATHVVTAILYGANGFFVFESEKLEKSSSREIGVKMEAVINKIPACPVTGELKNNLTEEEKDLTQKLTCKFFGDFILPKDPVTFEEALMTYAELPKLLGENGEKSVPLKVWFTPLKDLISSAAEVRAISLPLVREMQDTLEDFREIEMRCNDVLDDPAVQEFPQIEKKIKRFQKECSYYVRNIKRAVAEKFPLLREGKEDEEAVMELFKRRAESPFSSERLNKWMDDAETEINVVGSILEILKGARVLPNKSELNKALPNTLPGLCYIFTSLDSPDPHLDAMTSFLDMVDAKITKEDPWYHSDDVVQEMRRLARKLNVESGHVLISAIAREDIRGACLYKHYGGRLQAYDPYLSLDVEKVTEKKDLIFYSCDLTLDPETAYKALDLTEDITVSYGSSKKREDLPLGFDSLPQILCKQGLNKRCYWEVEFDPDDSRVLVGVCYKGMSKKGSDNAVKLGANAMSWCLDVRELKDKKKATFTAMHDGHSVSIPEKGSTRVAVFLDWHGGTLSFYNVSSTKLSHLHTFRNTFSEPIYPAFSVSKKQCSLLGLFNKLAV